MAHRPPVPLFLWRTRLCGDLACVCNHWFTGLVILGDTSGKGYHVYKRRIARLLCCSLRTNVSAMFFEVRYSAKGSFTINQDLRVELLRIHVWLQRVLLVLWLSILDRPRWPFGWYGWRSCDLLFVPPPDVSSVNATVESTLISTMPTKRKCYLRFFRHLAPCRAAKGHRGIFD